ncbi:TetR/AcrR family transcriptional regulator [Streptomyces fungicidicus]|uniref:TetR/AcrR family transcriptional regulator n=1 Tax=Streptomyces fungicidicus TaxID=68203 RepID=UPI0037A29CCC
MLQTGSSATTREAIRSAAARLFRNKGFSRTTVRQIATAADTGGGTAVRTVGGRRRRTAPHGPHGTGVTVRRTLQEVLTPRSH